MNIFGVGLPEIAVIGAIALLIFGPKRLPEFGRTLGKTLKGVQAASSEFEREIQKAMADPEEQEDQSAKPQSSERDRSPSENYQPPDEALNPPKN